VIKTPKCKLVVAICAAVYQIGFQTSRFIFCHHDLGLSKAWRR